MPPRTDDPDPYARAIKSRLAALERIFGKHDDYLVSPIPFYLDGDPTVIGFPNHLKGATVYCSSEMTGGWGSGQKPGPLGEYEFAIVLPNASPLGPRHKGNQLVAKGWSGFLLSGHCKYSRETLMKHGDTSGPLPPEFAPHNNLLLIELAGGRIPFEFDGRRYGLLLLMTISDAELDYKNHHGSAALIAKLHEAKAFPITNPSRPSVV